MEQMIHYISYAVFGYLCGSILFGYWIPKLVKGIDVRQVSDDGNPGTANNFTHAGIPCGIAVLLCDLLKGFLPVYLAARQMDVHCYLFALVLAAPVLGHILPLYTFFKGGGKGIATTFGVALGLVPYWGMAVLLAFWYLFFSLIVIVRPHTVRTVVTYFCWMVSSFLLFKNRVFVWAAAGITFLVLRKHRREWRESREQAEVRLLFSRKARRMSDEIKMFRFQKPEDEEPEEEAEDAAEQKPVRCGSFEK